MNEEQQAKEIIQKLKELLDGLKAAMDDDMAKDAFPLSVYPPIAATLCASTLVEVAAKLVATYGIPKEILIKGIAKALGCMAIELPRGSARNEPADAQQQHNAERIAQEVLNRLRKGGQT